jgi:sulfide:quinone oxidoreductase
VVICGGGVAAVESLLALRALLTVGLRVHLVAPNRQFVYHPLAVAEPFGLAETHLFEIADIAADHGAELHTDSLIQVDGGDRSVILASGATLPYDALIVAIGAIRRDWLEGALIFGGAADVAAFRALLWRLENGSVQRLAFASPAGVSWTLPLYELALLTASHLAERHIVGVELTVVTPEADPLAVFGPAASRMLRELLADRGVRLRTGAYAEQITRGKLELHPHATLEVDEVIALPQLDGPRLPGLPADAAGFIRVDEHCQVAGLEGVYAAGDGTNFPVKQGGIATQQADTVAETIAGRMGAAVTPSPVQLTLRGMLLTGIAPAYLRAQIAGTVGDSLEVASNALWWPPSKIAGRYLAPYLAGHGPLARTETLQDRSPSTLNPAALNSAHEEARELAATFAEHDADGGHYKSALRWLEVIERLDGVLPPEYVKKRGAWKDSAGE